MLGVTIFGSLSSEGSNHTCC